MPDLQSELSRVFPRAKRQEKPLRAAREFAERDRRRKAKQDRMLQRALELAQSGRFRTMDVSEIWDIVLNDYEERK